MKLPVVLGVLVKKETELVEKLSNERKLQVLADSYLVATVLEDKQKFLDEFFNKHTVEQFKPVKENRHLATNWILRNVKRSSLIGLMQKRFLLETEFTNRQLNIITSLIACWEPDEVLQLTNQELALLCGYGIDTTNLVKAVKLLSYPEVFYTTGGEVHFTLLVKKFFITDEETGNRRYYYDLDGFFGYLAYATLCENKDWEKQLLEGGRELRTHIKNGGSTMTWNVTQKQDKKLFSEVTYCTIFVPKKASRPQIVKELGKYPKYCHTCGQEKRLTRGSLVNWQQKESLTEEQKLNYKEPIVFLCAQCISRLKPIIT
jgi:hypothetical protein